MKALFLGLGSIGIRHLRDLHAVCSEQGLPLCCHALRSENRPLPDGVSALLAFSTDDPAQLDADYDAAFVCTPTAFHRDSLKLCSGRTDAVFLEKPVFPETFTLPDPQLSAFKLVYTACPLRRLPVLQRMKELTPSLRIAAIDAVCSSYLPDWRPGTDYKSCYSADPALGGGVRLDLVHEWDYLQWLFDAPEQVLSRSGTVGDLGIRSEDCALYLAVWPDKLATLRLDYLGRSPRRTLSLLLKDGHRVEANLLTGAIEGEGISESHPAHEDCRLSETRHFLEILAGRTENDSAPACAKKVVELALG